MKRKIIALNDEVRKAKAKLAEIEQIRLEAEAEEKQIIDSVDCMIKQMEEDNGLFCGVMLTKNDIVAIVDIALKSGEEVKIPYKIYFNT